jgi:hypothetical protein
MKRLINYKLLFAGILIGLLILPEFVIAQTVYRVRMPASSYSAMLVGVAATYTAGDSIVGVYNATVDAHEFDVTKTGRYKLYYDAAGGTAWVLWTSWGGTNGKRLEGSEDLAWRSQTNFKWFSIALNDTSVGETQVKQSLAGGGLKGGAGVPFSVQTNDTTLEVVNDLVRIKNLSLGANQVAYNSLPGTKLQENAVGDTHIVDLKTAGKIKDGATWPFPKSLKDLSVSEFAAGIAKIAYLMIETQFNQLYTLTGGIDGANAVLDYIKTNFIDATFIRTQYFFCSEINGAKVVTDMTTLGLFTAFDKISNKKILIPAGTYTITRPIEIMGDSITTKGDGAGTILKVNTFLTDTTWIKQASTDGVTYADSIQITATSATAYWIKVYSTRLADFTGNLNKYVMIHPRSTTHNAQSFNGWKGIICRIESTTAPDIVKLAVYKFAPYWSSMWLGRATGGVNNSFVTDAIPVFIAGTTANEVDYLAIEDLVIDGGWTTKALPDTALTRDDLWDYSLWGAISLDVKDAYLNRVIVRNVGGMDGINVEASGLKVNNCSFNNISGAGIHFGGGTNDFICEGSTFYRCRESGIYDCFGDNRAIISTNIFEACGTGIDGIGGPVTTIDNDVLIEANIFKDCLYAGVSNYFGGYSKRVSVLNNQFYNTPGAHAGTAAIDMIAVATDTTWGENAMISNNLIVQDSSRSYIQYGINIENFRGGVILGNRIKNFYFTGSTGIRFEECTQLSIKMNNLDSCWMAIDEENNAVAPVLYGFNHVMDNDIFNSPTEIDMDSTKYGSRHFSWSDSTWQYLINGVWTPLTIN